MFLLIRVDDCNGEVSNGSSTSKKSDSTSQRLFGSQKQSKHSGRVIHYTPSGYQWSVYGENGKRSGPYKHQIKGRNGKVIKLYKSRACRKSCVSSSLLLPLLTKKNLYNTNGKSFKAFSFPKGFKEENYLASIELLKDLRNRHDGSKVSSFLDPLPFVMHPQLVPSGYFPEEEIKSILESAKQNHEDLTKPVTSPSGLKNDATVSFMPPTNGRVVDRIINYRLRVDGIACTTTSIMAETFYEVSLEVINCGEVDREQSYMFCHSLLFPKGQSTEENWNRNRIGKLKGFKMIDFYLHFVAVTGRTGVYIKKKSGKNPLWYHWRWFISSVVCDTVAQEELEGCSGKKFTSFPCLYCNSCQRLRFSLDTYGMQQMKAPVPMKGANRLSVIGHSMDFVHPNCMYRCAPIVYHWDKSIDIVTYFAKTGLRLTDEQVSELLTLKQLFSLFPDGSFHQYLPIALSPLSWIRYRINKVNKVCPQLLLDKESSKVGNGVKRMDNGNTTGNREDGNTDVDSDTTCLDEVVENVENNDSCMEEDSVEEDIDVLDCFNGVDEDIEVVEVDSSSMDEDSEALDRYGGENEYVEGLDNESSEEEQSSEEEDKTEYLCFVNRDSLQDHNRSVIIESLRDKPELEIIVGKVDEPIVFNKVLQLEKNICVPSKYREGVDAMHNIYNICLLFIKIINNEYSFDKSFNSVLDKYVRVAIFGDEHKAPSDWTISPDFSDILAKAKERRKSLFECLSYCSLLKQDLLIRSFFTRANDHDGMLFVFGFYHYLFQDSLNIPVIFLFKVIFDYLSYFFNFNGDLNELIVNQVNYNVIVGLLQSELAPSVLSS